MHKIRLFTLLLLVMTPVAVASAQEGGNVLTRAIRELQTQGLRTDQPVS